MQVKVKGQFLCLTMIALLILLLATHFDSLCATWGTNMVALHIVEESRSPTISESWMQSTCWLDFAFSCAPDAANALRLGGYLYLRQGWVSDAVDLLERVAPRDQMASFWLGEAYSRQGRHSDAVVAWRRAGAAPYFLALGHGPYGALDYETACLYYLRAVEIAPDMARAHMYAGHCYSRRGDLVLAEQAYRQAIQLDPKDGWSYLHLAGLLRRMGEPDKARGVLGSCIEQAQSGSWYALCQEANEALTGISP